MIRHRLIVLRQHRARLIGHARVEREHLGAVLGRIESSLSWVDVLQKGLGEVRQHPLLVLAGVTLLVALRPRWAVKLLARGWWLWQLYQRGRRVWALATALAAGAAARNS